MDVVLAVVATDGSLDLAVPRGAAAAQALDDGAIRVRTITPNADAPTDFTWAFGTGSDLSWASTEG